jgi:hypothetical protein
LVSAAGFRPKWASTPRYWLLALALFAVVAAATFMVFRADLSSEEQDPLTRLLEGRAVLLIMRAIGFFLPLAAFVHYFFRRYPAALNRVGKELRIIRTINRDHRLEPIGAPEVKRVVTEINRFVDIHTATLRGAEARLSEAPGKSPKRRSSSWRSCPNSR